MNTIRKRRQAIIGQKPIDNIIHGEELEWEMGLLISGVVDSSYTSYISTTDFIPIKNRELNYLGPSIYNIDTNVNYIVAITQYNASKTYVTRRNCTINGIGRQFQLNANVEYIKISYGYSSSYAETEEPMSIDKGELCQIEKIKSTRTHLTWDDLFYAIDHNTYALDYDLGEILPLTLNGNSRPAQIVAFNEDDLADDTGKAPVSFMITNALWWSGGQMCTSAATADSETGLYIEGTGTIGGYSKMTAGHNRFNITTYNWFTSSVKNRIATVKKVSLGYNTSGVKTEYTTNEKVYPLSYREMFGGTTCETTGAIYTWFNSNSRRKASNSQAYPLRTANSISVLKAISTTGSSTTQNTNKTGFYHNCGFCIK